MKQKRLSIIILIGILFLLVAAVIGMKMYQEKKQEVPAAKSFYKDLKIDNVDKIEITKAGKALSLVKENGKWLEMISETEKAEADSEAIKILLDKTKNIKVGEIITDKADKQELFQVNSAGLQVIFYQGEEKLADFYLGKTTPDFNGNYLRRNGENNIYSTTERISSYYSQNTFVKKSE